MDENNNNSIDISEQDAARHIDALVRKYKILAEFTSTRAEPLAYSPLMVLVHVALTGPHAPHGRLNTVDERRAYLEKVFCLEPSDADILMALYLQATRQAPRSYPHIQNLLASAKQRIAEIDADQWPNINRVSNSVH